MERLPDIPAYYDSLTATAEGLKIPIALVKSWKASGCEAFRHGRVDVRDLVRWVATKDRELPDIDLDTANTYVAIERAELLRMEKEEKKKSLMSYNSAMQYINRWFLPIRQKLLSLSAEMATKCNPTDPELARTQLDEWTKQAMRQIQDAIATPENERTDDILGEPTSPA